MSGRRATVIAWVVCCAAGVAAAPTSFPLSPPDAAAACGSTKLFAPKRDAGPGRAPLLVGDSVLLGAAEEAAALGYAVDVRICRSTNEGLDRLRRRARARDLPRFAVIALGANSDFTPRDVRSALRILGPRRKLGLITPNEVPGQSTGDARTMRRLARRFRTRIVLIDWVRYSSRRRGLTYSDGIHLTPKGQRAMKRLLRRALRRAARQSEPAARRRARAPGGTPDADPSPAEEEGGGAEAPKGDR